jgi:ABC-type transport system substrate-binding protein
VRVFASLAVLLLALVGIVSVHRAQVAPAAPVPVPEPKAKGDPAPDAATTLRIPFAQGAPGLDPHRASGNDPLSMRVISLVYDSLYMWEPGESGHVVPALADGWPAISEDGLTVTIKLRKGVKFHKHACFGEARTRDLTSADVVKSIKRAAMYRETGMGWLLDTLVVGLDDYAHSRRRRARVNNAPVEGLSAPDDSTVVLTLTRPYGSLPTMLAHPGFSIMPSEAMDGAVSDLGERAVGTGPYRQSAISQGVVYAFSRVDGHWGGDPHYQRILFASDNWGEFDEKFAQGKYAEFQLWGSTMTELVKEGNPIERLQPAELCHLDGHGYYFVSFNMDDPIWGAMDDDGRNLRRAVALACDPHDFMAALGLDQMWSGTQPSLLPIGTLYADTSDAGEYGKHDLDAAKKLLEKTKYKGGMNPDTGKRLELDLLSSSDGANTAMDRMLRKALNNLGMQLTVRNVEDEEYRSVSHSADQQAFVAGWFLDYPDPMNFFQLFHSRNAGKGHEFSNIARYSSTDFDKLLDAYERLLPTPENEGKRRELTAAMSKQIAKDQPTIPVMHQKRAYIRSGKIDWPSMPRQTYNDLRFAKEKAE